MTRPEPEPTTVPPAAVRESWEKVADWWDAQLGEGNGMQRLLVWPTAERLLGLGPGDRLLEVGCGNGSFARRQAAQGVRVLGVDLAERFVEIARERSASVEPTPEFRQLDAGDPSQLAGLPAASFDAIAALMVLMDMQAIGPLLSAVPRLLRPDGRFVIAVTHPCFNGATVVRTVEEVDTGVAIAERRSVRVHEYSTPRAGQGVAVPGQPHPHYYFDRPIAELLRPAFQAGLVVDALEEPTFREPMAGTRPLSWTAFPEIPPALVLRFRVV